MGSAAAAGDIVGKVTNWPRLAAGSPRQGVVWLQGIPPKAASKVQPVMAQRGGQFVPSFLIVVAGQTVSMPNEDDVAHSVYSVSQAKTFNLGFYARGDPKSVTFDRPGVVEVACIIHRSMRAQILVVPNAYFAVVAPDGSFRIRNVPAGSFTLTFWSDGMPSASQGVTLPEGAKSASINLIVPDADAGK